MKPTDMMETAFDYDDRLHVVLWEVTEHEAELSKEVSYFSRHHCIASIAFAFHTIEAYLNFVGELVAPQAWKKKHEDFTVRQKMKFVMDQVGLVADEKSRPFSTVIELKKLRDQIAHGKRTRMKGRATHTREEFVGFQGRLPRWSQAVRDKDELIPRMLKDVEAFAEQIHKRAKGKVKTVDPLFRFPTKALRGFASIHQSATRTVSSS